jgi:hypothetical protein
MDQSHTMTGIRMNSAESHPNDKNNSGQILKNQFARSLVQLGTMESSHWSIQGNSTLLRVHAKSLEAEPELWKRESLCQEIGHHLIGGDVREHHVTLEDTVPHNVVDDVNVLCGWADSTMIE